MDFKEKLIYILLALLFICNFFWWSYNLYMTYKVYNYDYTIDNTNHNINEN